MNPRCEDLADEGHTGNTAEKNAAEQRKAHAKLENDASHIAVKAGPFNLSSSGAATVDNQDRRDGKFNQAVGSGKEFVGNAVGSDNLKREGREQNAEGQGQEAAGQIADFASGVGKFTFLLIAQLSDINWILANRVTGTIGSLASGIVGNKEAQCKFFPHFVSYFMNLG